MCPLHTTKIPRVSQHVTGASMEQSPLPNGQLRLEQWCVKRRAVRCHNQLRSMFFGQWRVQASSTLFTVTSAASVQDHSRHAIDRNNNDSDETLTYLNFENKIVKMRNSLTKFGWNFECWAVQKRVNLVDLVKSFQTSIQYLVLFSIYLHILTSTQPRMGLSKFAKNSPNVGKHLEKT